MAESALHPSDNSVPLRRHDDGESVRLGDRVTPGHSRASRKALGDTQNGAYATGCYGS